MANADLLGNPGLAEVLDMLREAVSTELRVALPGRVVSYNTSTRQAEVQPLIMRRSFNAASAVNLAIIPNVPIMHPQTQAGALLLPVAAGDPVTLVFSDRSLDQWKASTGVLPTEAQEKRKHELSDCWAFLGGWPEALPFTAASEGNLALQVAPGTKVYVGNGSAELLNIMNDIGDVLNSILTNIQALTVAGVSTGGGASGAPVNAADFAANAVDLTALLTLLGQIKP